jgi:hypothetical protein
MIKEMITSIEYQKKRENGENESLKEIYKPCEVVLERPFNLNYEGDQNISPIIGVEKSFPVNHQVFITINKFFI